MPPTYDRACPTQPCLHLIPVKTRPLDVSMMSPVFLGGVSPAYNVIITDRDTITPYTMGAYLDVTWEFRDVGFVNDATGDWAYLVAWTTYAYGFTMDPSTWGDQYTCTGYRVFLPPLPAKWGKLGVWKPQVMWPDVFSKCSGSGLDPGGPGSS